MSGGTLSPGAPSLRYNAGPFAVPKVTGTTSTVDCSAPGSCDDYALAVATPAGHGSTYTVRVSVSWPDSAGDFGVYLLLPAGRQVAPAASSSDPEVMQVAGSPGSCTVRVVPSAPAGQSITADISLLCRWGHLRQRPQPAGLHRRHGGPGWTGPGRLGRRLHGRVRHHHVPDQHRDGLPRRAGDDRPATQRPAH